MLETFLLLRYWDDDNPDEIRILVLKSRLLSTVVYPDMSNTKHVLGAETLLWINNMAQNCNLH